MNKVVVSFPKLLWEQVMNVIGAISSEIWRRRAIYRGQKLRDSRKKSRKLEARLDQSRALAASLAEEVAQLKKSLGMPH